MQATVANPIQSRDWVSGYRGIGVSGYQGIGTAAAFLTILYLARR